jgi:hypothetical protein
VRDSNRGGGPGGTQSIENRGGGKGTLSVAPMALSSPVRQWGLLSWNKRWITFESPTIRLFKSETGPEGDPIVTFDLSDSVCKFEVDPVNANRLSLDNSIALIHIKFDDAGTRAVRCRARSSMSRISLVPCPLPRFAKLSLSWPPLSAIRLWGAGIRRRVWRGWR